MYVWVGLSKNKLPAEFLFCPRGIQKQESMGFGKRRSCVATLTSHLTNGGQSQVGPWVAGNEVIV